MNIFEKRRRALLSNVGAEGYLVVDLARLMPKEIDHTSLYYLTGYDGEGVLIITQQESVLLADERYFETAKTQLKDDTLKVHPAAGYYLSNIKDELDRLAIRELSFTSNRITYSLFDRLQKLTDVKLTPRQDPVAKLRMIKDQSEIEKIKTAVKISQTCLTQLVEEIKVGMTEKEIAIRLDMLILQSGAECAFETIVASGENSFHQHHKPSDRQIRAEDFLLIDFGARKDEYLADITRTFVVRSATPKMEAIYETAKTANQVGIDNLVPGVSIKAVWQKIKDHFNQSEFSKDSDISGHCIGIDVHEHPFITPDETIALQPGMVTTMEPGIYIFGYGGVRIEDDVLITPDGPEVLTGFTKELTFVG